MVYIANLNNGFFESLLYLNEYYGVTQNPSTKDFIIIMKYYRSDLRSYITNDFYNIKWNKKLEILIHIAKGLDHIHKQDIIHRDLHSKNILCKNEENEDDIVISDLGISKSAMESTCDNKIYGVISYIAPENLQGKEYTKASDIYSFGMIMWELMTGRKPFWDQKNDTELMIKVKDGLRPSIVTNTPKDYVKLMQECWSSNPIKRPMAAKIFERLMYIRAIEMENPIEIIKSSDNGPIMTNDPDISVAIFITHSSEQGNQDA